MKEFVIRKTVVQSQWDHPLHIRAPTCVADCLIDSFVNPLGRQALRPADPEGRMLEFPLCQRRAAFENIRYKVYCYSTAFWSTLVCTKYHSLLLLDTDDHPVDLFDPTKAGCSDHINFSAVAVDFTLDGAVTDSGLSSVEISIGSFKIPGDAAYDPEKEKVWDLTKHKKELALLLRIDNGFTWKRSFDFHQFDLIDCGDIRPADLQDVDQFSLEERVLVLSTASAWSVASQ